MVDGKEYKPEQIAAFVLQKIKADAEKFLGQPKLTDFAYMREKLNLK